MARARAGDEEAYRRLRPLLDNGQTVEDYGNVAVRSLEIAAHDFSGKDLFTLDALLRKLESLRRELGGPDPTPLERLLVDRVVTMWFHLHKLEADHVASCGSRAEGAAEYQRAIKGSEGRPCPDGAVQATGFSGNQSFDEAFGNAVAALPAFVPPFPDAMDRIEVLEVGGLFGGIAGFRHLFVRVCRVPQPA